MVSQKATGCGRVAFFCPSSFTCLFQVFTNGPFSILSYLLIIIGGMVGHLFEGKTQIAGDVVLISIGLKILPNIRYFRLHNWN